MKYTLVLIGMSLFLNAVDPVYNAFSNKNLTNLPRKSIEYLSQVFEKVGIIIDIARLSKILITLK